MKLTPEKLLGAVVVPAVLARLAIFTAAVSVVVVVVAVVAGAVAITVLPAVRPRTLLPMTEGITIIVEHAQVQVEITGGVGERYFALFKAMIAPSTVEAAATVFTKGLSTLGCVEQRRK